MASVKFLNIVSPPTSDWSWEKEGSGAPWSCPKHDLGMSMIPVLSWDLELRLIGTQLLCDERRAEHCYAAPQLMFSRRHIHQSTTIPTSHEIMETF